VHYLIIGTQRLVNTGRWIVWSLFALVLAGGASWYSPAACRVTMLSQMGIAIIACLSYNMLLGQGGMLSFGHAVYTGLALCGHSCAQRAIGGAAAHAGVTAYLWWAGLAGMAFAVLFGYVTTRKVGHHLCHDHAGLGRAGVCHVADVPEFFGGEGGVSGNRVHGQAISWASPMARPSQVYYLIAVYTFVSVVA